MNETAIINGASVYHAHPDRGTHPGLIVIEEIWGVTNHIKDVAGRFAKEGYQVLSPELLPKGLLEQLTPDMPAKLFDSKKRNEVQPKLRAAMGPLAQPGFAEGSLKTLKACIDYLLADEHSNGKVGVAGFCFGGSYAYHLAAHDARVKAAAPFYGQPPSEKEIAGIECPILAFYGEKDAALMESLPQLKEAMRKHGSPFETVVYPGVGHAFFNDTNPNAYGAKEAKDAWQKVLAFFEQQLR